MGVCIGRSDSDRYVIETITVHSWITRWRNVCIPSSRYSDIHYWRYVLKNRRYTPLLWETYFNGTWLRLLFRNILVLEPSPFFHCHCRTSGTIYVLPSHGPLVICKLLRWKMFLISMILLCITPPGSTLRHEDRELGGEHRYPSCCSIGHCQCKLGYSQLGAGAKL